MYMSIKEVYLTIMENNIIKTQEFISNARYSTYRTPTPNTFFFSKLNTQKEIDYLNINPALLQ